MLQLQSGTPRCIGHVAHVCRKTCGVHSRGLRDGKPRKSFLDILQPRAILIYDEAEVGTTKARTTKMPQELARDGLARPPLFGTPFAWRVEIDSCAV